MAKSFESQYKNESFIHCCGIVLSSGELVLENFTIAVIFTLHTFLSELLCKKKCKKLFLLIIYLKVFKKCIFVDIF